MPASTIEPRRPRFDIPADVPHHWHGGKRSVTTFFDNLSLFFPVGERFFMTAVNAHRAHVSDRALLADVRAFCLQEGAHGREHDRYNRMLADHGYPVVAMEGRVSRLLDRVRKYLPKRWQLAATCALEHFTALLGQSLLADERVLAGAHPVMRALWRWHAAEEIEHKSVAYDVYLAAGGHYAERVFVMLMVAPIFWGKVLEHQVRMMKADGTLLSGREWASLLGFLFATPGALSGLVGPFFEYFRPGFHPSDVDARPLLAAWKEDYVAGDLPSEGQRA